MRISKVALTLALSWPTESLADDSKMEVSDPIAGTRGSGDYGRFNRPWSASAGALIEVTPVNGEIHVGALGTFRYLQTLGAYFSFRQSTTPESSTFQQIASVGAIFEPLFLLRWKEAKEVGPAFLDLTVDSFSINFGGYYAHTNTAKTHRGGLEVGLGFGIPLTGKAPGPWLRTKANFLTGGNSEGATIWVLVDWQFFVGAE